jgi:hypothetical protein
MDIDEDRRSTNTSPSLTSSMGQSGRRTTTLPRIVPAADSETVQHPSGRQQHYSSNREPSVRDPNANATVPREGPPYAPRHSFPPAPTSPRRYHYPGERYYSDDRRHLDHHSPYSEHSYPTRPYSAVETERHPYREPYPRSPRDAYAQYALPQRPTSAFDERYHHQSPRRSLSPPRFRPVNRDPRDRSPSSRYPHYPQERPYPPMGTYPGDVERGYSPRPPNREHRALHGIPGTPEYAGHVPSPTTMSLEEFAETADRWSHTLGRYAPVSRDRTRAHSPFTFAHHQGPGHTRGRSEGDNGRDRILPPAREILSVSPEVPSTTGTREARRWKERQHEQFHPYSTTVARPADYYNNGSQHAPEEILQSMSLQAITRPSRMTVDNTRERHQLARLGDRARIVGPARAGSDHHQHHESSTTGVVMARGQDPQTPQHRSSHVPSIQPSRTGFPNSGLRSTAPATPPNPRRAEDDSRTNH